MACLPATATWAGTTSSAGELAGVLCRDSARRGPTLDLAMAAGGAELAGRLPCLQPAATLHLLRGSNLVQPPAGPSEPPPAPDLLACCPGGAAVPATSTTSPPCWPTTTRAGSAAAAGARRHKTLTRSCRCVGRLSRAEAVCTGVEAGAGATTAASQPLQMRGADWLECFPTVQLPASAVAAAPALLVAACPCWCATAAIGSTASCQRPW